MLPPSAAIDHTVAFTPFVGPLPSADHALPSHTAILFTLTPPAWVNCPPTYTLLPLTARAYTSPFTPFDVPVPREDHVLPSHLATRLAGTPPALRNLPPA